MQIYVRAMFVNTLVLIILIPFFLHKIVVLNTLDTFERCQAYMYTLGAHKCNRIGHFQVVIAIDNKKIHARSLILTLGDTTEFPG